MVAKAKGDLFDVNVGGAGFHVTAHLIALAALFIACFALAGYISFRDDSVPDSALKSGADSSDFLIATVSPDLTVNTHNKTIGTLPARAAVKSVTVVTETLSVGAATSTLDYSVGTVADADRIAASDNIMTAGALVAPYTTIGDGLTPALATTGRVISNGELELIVAFTVGTAALTTAGSYRVVVEYTVA